ncbi:MAG: bifunctional oligoribonuclease/PAP phosphatase NrnA [Candidatus Margulisbacteria bacterium]|nr:bifunctional oligoribonuclease/PAP phosphatase NrnA [Candidatus Margulisiibacteriota bacterium]MBU1021658.1 bifunctional oligoribonuclease/PAP phosphatase NrnA [Candidatus Margulisiibacteriota bacterium]MBU1728808.1 bifunctional oligoribonuclease/PAP phosphatase NrnA [Candidatus Margulisiibacteriota bacterium]MBU1955774.1 bifunctional oligoribonuclease/PAP phosphatase NrnA [Candidatus Margulisiibacteriota bacterium]
MIKNLKSVAKLLKKENSFLIVCHIDPDGDTIGSALGLKFVLNKLGKNVTVYSRDHIPKIYQFLPGISSIKQDLPQSKTFDVIISVDAGDVKRIGNAPSILPRGKTLVNIDHHPDNTYYGDLNLVEGVSCVAELIYKLAKELKVKLDAKAAICLYVAMMTDTGNFKYENTTAKTFGIAKDLVEAGADPSEAAIHVYEEKPFTAVAIHAFAASHAKLAHGGKVIWSTIKRSTMKKMHATDEDLNGIVDKLRAVEGVEVAILIREHGKNQVKANFRSKRRVNVQKIANKLGGGGHVRSSGAVIKGKIDAVEKKVIKTVLDQLK